MRDLASCFSEYAVNVSETSCSRNSCVSPAVDSLPSVQNSVTCLYRTSFAGNHLFVTLTWCRTSANCHGLSIALNDDTAAVRLTASSRIFRKMRGGRTVEFRGAEVELAWDLTSARYGSGPEPVDGFSISIAVDSEVCFFVGDGPGSRLLRPSGKFWLISREEQHHSDEAVYSTRARFSDDARPHDIQIRCGDGDGDGDGKGGLVLAVSIDKKPVIRVKRLHWNFRGNQTIFLDGLLVDLLWDAHDWFHRTNGSGCSARFMFRTRTRLESRLWIEEEKKSSTKLVRDDDGDKAVEFSLMIHAWKNASSSSSSSN